MINTDFTNEEDYALADEGVQVLTVEKVYEKVSKNGKDMVVFELRAENGGKVFHNCMNYDGCRWMLKKTLHALSGQKPAKGQMSFEPEDYIGEGLKVDIFHDEFNGRVSAKIKDVLLPGDDVPGSATLPEEEF